MDGAEAGGIGSEIGARAETRVIEALQRLPAPWQYFNTVEWRSLQPGGETVGEADVVVFHPHHGLIIFEIKAGAVEVREGTWFYASGLPMKHSPFSQARRNRYALADKLRQRLGATAMESLAITHAAWFPEVVWRAALPGIEAPSRAFLLDRTHLDDPAPALLRIFREATPEAQAWTRSQQQALKELLAPDCRCLVPLASVVDDTVAALHHATEEQVQVLRLLRTQPRLLVEGGAGTGKTALAMALAREHAAQGKAVLLTCFNKALGRALAQALEDVPGMTVQPFHELARSMAQTVGLDYAVPADIAAQGPFFREQSAELLLSAAEMSSVRFDTVIVDEAADFAPTWWVALAALGTPDFSWYCFYDRRQSLFQEDTVWEPPFTATPMSLDANLRNTRAIGEFAARLGHYDLPQRFRVDQGQAPSRLASVDFLEMAQQLRGLLRDLLRQQALKPEQIAVLSPYRHDNPQSTWSAGLNEIVVSTDMATPAPGTVRVGTIQGFKGLEADVVILVGLDERCIRHPATLYVGASRARAVLFVLALASAGLENSHTTINI